jgi:hypothetical protein
MVTWVLLCGQCLGIHTGSANAPSPTGMGTEIPSHHLCQGQVWVLSPHPGDTPKVTGLEKGSLQWSLC